MGPIKFYQIGEVRVCACPWSRGVGLNVNTVVIGGRQDGPIESAKYSLHLFPLFDDSVKFLSEKLFQNNIKQLI